MPFAAEVGTQAGGAVGVDQSRTARASAGVPEPGEEAKLPVVVDFNELAKALLSGEERTG